LWPEVDWSVRETQTTLAKNITIDMHFVDPFAYRVVFLVDLYVTKILQGFCRPLADENGLRCTFSQEVHPALNHLSPIFGRPLATTQFTALYAIYVCK